MMRNLFLNPVLFVLLVIAFVRPAAAIEIQEVVSPLGIKAWLVEDRTIPLIAMQFSFKSGGAFDPPGKDGVTNFLTGMLDEGAGTMDSAQFQAKREELAFKMGYNAGFDYFEGSFQTLSRNAGPSFELLKLAVNSPRFDPEPLVRVRQQFLLGARDDAENPDRIASQAWMEATLGSHPYARSLSGTEATVTTVTSGDLAAAHKRIFTRSTLQVAVVGDIDPLTLARQLDSIFGGLPESAPMADISLAAVSPGPSIKIIDRDIPQSIIVFGHEGILRNDKDFFAAFVMSQILGGGEAASRLTGEIREKRGLTYGVGASLVPMARAGLFLGSLNTRNDKAGEALELVKAVMKRLAEEGPSQQELDEAKTYLTGSYALRFDSNNKIAGQLLGIQQQGLGLDYVTRRNSLIEAVTLDQVKEQAKRLLHPERLIVTVVGKPEGVSNVAP